MAMRRWCKAVLSEPVAALHSPKQGSVHGGMIGASLVVIQRFTNSSKHDSISVRKYITKVFVKVIPYAFDTSSQETKPESEQSSNDGRQMLMK